jgi:hypothetical protein
MRCAASTRCKRLRLSPKPSSGRCGACCHKGREREHMNAFVLKSV